MQFRQEKAVLEKEAKLNKTNCQYHYYNYVAIIIIMFYNTGGGSKR